MKAREWLGWIALILFPLALAFILLSALPLPDVIAVHFGLDGTPNRWGSKYELLLVGGIMGSANLLIAIMYWKIEVLFALGLVNGIRTIRGARLFLWGTGIFVTAVAAGLNILLITTALNAL